MEGQEDKSRSSGLNFVNGPRRNRNYPSRGTITRKTKSEPSHFLIPHGERHRVRVSFVPLTRKSMTPIDEVGKWFRAVFYKKVYA